MIYGPKGDGTYVVDFRGAEGDVLAMSIPRSRMGCSSQRWIRALSSARP
jgi:hypothetical protein